MIGFIKLPIFLVNRKMQELDVPCEDRDAILHVRPETIIAYNDTLDEDEKDITMVYLSNGDNFLCDCTAEELEKILNEIN
jgi:hypothetical protein